MFFKCCSFAEAVVSKFLLKMTETADSEEIIVKWLMDYAFFNAWSEFSSNHTVENAVDRDLIQGMSHFLFTREPMCIFTYVQIGQILKVRFCIELFKMRYS